MHPPADAQNAPYLNVDSKQPGNLKQILKSIIDDLSRPIKDLQTRLMIYQNYLRIGLEGASMTHDAGPSTQTINNHNWKEAMKTQLRGLLGSHYDCWMDKVLRIKLMWAGLTMCIQNKVGETFQNIHSHTQHALGTYLRDIRRFVGAQRNSKQLIEMRLQNDDSEKLQRHIDTLGIATNELQHGLYNNVPVIAGWELNNLQSSQSNEFGLETCFTSFERERVDRADLGVDGKYRAVCKINVRSNKGYHWSGTGFLTDGSHVVTAAHNMFSRRHGHAVSVDVHVGFNGHHGFNGGTQTHNSLETQKGAYVAIHWGYYATNIGACDFAVIRVEKPFQSVKKYIQYRDCPETGKDYQVTLIGYPGDVPEFDLGLFMYASKEGKIASFNLKKSNYVLEHLLPTYPGNSGSPLFELTGRGEISHAIAVHRAGNDITNTATAFGVKGNSIQAFVDSLKLMAGQSLQGVELHIKDLDNHRIPNLKQIWPTAHASASRDVKTSLG